MSKNRREIEEENNEGTWLATYGDLVTLLLCFFILLFGMSTIDNIKFKQLVGSFQPEGRSIIPEYDTEIPALIQPDNYKVMPLEEDIDIREQKKFEKITKELTEFFSENNMQQSVEVFNQQEGVLIRFTDNVIFDKGSAALRADAVNILAGMAELLYSYDRMIKVEGHTDDDPIHSLIYPSNWELSTARAVNVVKFFTQQVPDAFKIKPTLIQAAGYGEFHPLVPNTDEANKTLNRRIEIVILKDLKK